jgi:hypothetical protein
MTLTSRTVESLSGLAASEIAATSPELHECEWVQYSRPLTRRGSNAQTLSYMRQTNPGH